MYHRFHCNVISENQQQLLHRFPEKEDRKGFPQHKKYDSEHLLDPLSVLRQPNIIITVYDTGNIQITGLMVWRDHTRLRSWQICHQATCIGIIRTVLNATDGLLNDPEHRSENGKMSYKIPNLILYKQEGLVLFIQMFNSLMPREKKDYPAYCMTTLFVASQLNPLYNQRSIIFSKLLTRGEYADSPTIM